MRLDFSSRCGAPRRSLLSIALLAAASAQAHVTLETPQAAAGSYYKAVFRVGHGCAGSPVTQVIVHIPPGVQGAKPMVKPGWRIDIERAKLDPPYTSHGRAITEDVSQIRFTGGPLPDAHYDEFALNVKLPEQAGPMHWKVSQVCEQGRIDWAELPQAGQSLHDLKAPAALLDIVPAAHAGHAH
jgi:periplasmic copper chaperone A